MQFAYSNAFCAALFCVVHASAARTSLLLLTASAHRDVDQIHRTLATDDAQGGGPVDDLQKDYNDDEVEPKPPSKKAQGKEKMEHAIAIGLAIMFLGVVFLAGFISFLLAYPDEQVRYYCVRIASSTVIIFVAISIEYTNMLSTCVAKMTGWKDGGWKSKIIPFFFYWSLTLFVSYKVRHSHMNMIAAKSVLSHVAAFVAIYLISDLMYGFAATVSLDNQDCLQKFAARFGILVACAITFWILRMLTTQVIYRLPYDCPFPERKDLSTDEGADEATVLDEQGDARETGHGKSEVASRRHSKDSPSSVLHFAAEMEEAFLEASLLVLSYLAAKFLAYKTVLEFCGLDHKDETYTTRRKFWTISNDHVQEAVLAMALVTTLLQLALLVLDRRFSSRYMHEAVPTFLCMCVAWSFMHFCKCMLMVPISEAHCVLVSLAFLMTPAAGLLVVLADFFADRGTISDDLADVLVTSYGFMIGFSWEKAYHSSTHILLDDYFSKGVLYVKSQEDVKFAWTVAICAGAALIMLPGWRYLILPSALKPMPPREKSGQKSPTH